MLPIASVYLPNILLFRAPMSIVMEKNVTSNVKLLYHIDLIQYWDHLTSAKAVNCFDNLSTVQKIFLLMIFFFRETEIANRSIDLIG